MLKGGTLKRTTNSKSALFFKCFTMHVNIYEGNLSYKNIIRNKLQENCKEIQYIKN